MGKSFKSAAAFRISLEARLKSLHTEIAVPINSLRLKVVIKRLLEVEGVYEGNAPWIADHGMARYIHWIFQFLEEKVS